MSEERIQRILARAGVASRRKAEELIREARVTVNGQVAGIGDKADPAKDAIKVDGKRVHPHEGPYRYLLLNKPRGVMSTVADPQERKTVMDFVPPALRKALVPVGRLDFDSEGLILLTDDGDFAQHVAHPRYGGSKTYEVKVKGEPSEGMLDRLREGIVLEGERTAPARIVRRTKGPQRRRGGDASRARADDEGHNSWWVVELTQGRTRQIREMFLRIGHPVQKLRRVAIGPLRDPHLPTGAVRELSEREVETLRRITARPKKKKEPGETAAARKAAPGKKTVPAKKRAPAKKPLSVKRAAQGEPPKAAKKAPARKAGVKRAPAKKTSAKKAPAKRSPAQRSPAKKGGAGGSRRTSGAPRGRRP